MIHNIHHNSLRYSKMLIFPMHCFHREDRLPKNAGLRCFILIDSNEALLTQSICYDRSPLLSGMVCTSLADVDYWDEFLSGRQQYRYDFGDD